MLDVTYYLREEFSIANRPNYGPEDTVHYASGSFHTVPGPYKLPWGCGKYIVENRVTNTLATRFLGFTPTFHPQRIT